MKMPEKGCALVRLVIPLLIGVALAAPAADAPPRIKLATLVPRGSSYHQSLVEMGEAWKKAPGGGVSLTVYPDGTMGGEGDVVRKMRIGQVQAAMLTAVGLSEIDSSVDAVQLLPMAFRDLSELDFVMSKMRGELERRLETKGFVVLFWTDGGWIRFFSKQPVRHPQDLKSMKLFTWAGDSRMEQVLKSSGYNSVPLETSDILPGLQTGLINAIFTIPYYALSSQMYTHCPYMLEVNWAPLLGGGVMTKKAWDSIPPGSREAVKTAAQRAGEQVKAKSRKESNEAVDAMKKRGLKVTAMTPELEAEWRAGAQVLYPKIRGTVVPADLYDQVQALLKQAPAPVGAPKK
jgi:TRAP-type C4-dicarboxylate transport system substrate-binding protein